MLQDPETYELVEVCKIGDRYPEGFDFDSDMDLKFGYYVREPEAWDSFEIGLEVRRTAQNYLERK